MLEKFPYVLDNLKEYAPSMIEWIFGAIFVTGLLFWIRLIFLYSYGFFQVRKDEGELKKKKETLSDLILMKDIQTELEKEIEQAMLKATFQG